MQSSPPPAYYEACVPQQYVPQEFVPQEHAPPPYVPHDPGAARVSEGYGRKAEVPALQKSMSLVAPHMANRIRDKVR